MTASGVSCQVLIFQIEKRVARQAQVRIANALEDCDISNGAGGSSRSLTFTGMRSMPVLAVCHVEVAGRLFHSNQHLVNVHRTSRYCRL